MFLFSSSGMKNDLSHFRSHPGHPSRQWWDKIICLSKFCYTQTSNLLSNLHFLLTKEEKTTKMIYVQDTMSKLLLTHWNTWLPQRWESQRLKKHFRLKIERTNDRWETSGERSRNGQKKKTSIANEPINLFKIKVKLLREKRDSKSVKRIFCIY